MFGSQGRYAHILTDLKRRLHNGNTKDITIELDRRVNLMNHPLYSEDGFMVPCQVKESHISRQMCERMACGNPCEASRVPLRITSPPTPWRVAPQVSPPKISTVETAPACKSQPPKRGSPYSVPAATLCLRCKRATGKRQRGLCSGCYSAMSRDGTLDKEYPIFRKKEGVCMECGAVAFLKAKGQCKRCYDREYHRNKALKKSNSACIGKEI